MGAALAIRGDLTPAALRRRARHEPNRRAALRMMAIANALEGVSRAEAARLAGMERAAVSDLLLIRTVKATLPGVPCFRVAGISTELASLAVSFSIIVLLHWFVRVVLAEAGIALALVADYFERSEHR